MFFQLAYRCGRCMKCQSLSDRRICNGTSAQQCQERRRAQLQSSTSSAGSSPRFHGCAAIARRSTLNRLSSTSGVVPVERARLRQPEFSAFVPPRRNFSRCIIINNFSRAEASPVTSTPWSRWNASMALLVWRPRIPSAGPGL